MQWHTFYVVHGIDTMVLVVLVAAWNHHHQKGSAQGCAAFISRYMDMGGEMGHCGPQQLGRSKPQGDGSNMTPNIRNILWHTFCAHGID
jgi:hypothetical protein